MGQIGDSRTHFDPDQNARDKAAARQCDEEHIAAGEIYALALSRQNSMRKAELDSLQVYAARKLIADPMGSALSLTVRGWMDDPAMTALWKAKVIGEER